MSVDKINKHLEICLQATCLDQLSLVYELLPLALFLNQADESLAGFRTVDLWFLYIVAGTEFVKKAVYQFVARAAMTVLQVLVIFLLNSVPWKVVCKFDPAVQLAQS